MADTPRAPGATSTTDPGGVELGPNAGLVDEMYRRYQDNPNSIAPVWREFFADYTPRAGATPPNGERSGPKGSAEPAQGQDGRASDRPSGREPEASGGGVAKSTINVLDGEQALPLRGTAKAVV